MGKVHQIDRNTGIEYVYESKSYWDKEKKQSRYHPRKLVGHIDKLSGELVPNRQRKASPSNPSAKRLFCGTSHLLDALSIQIGLDKDLEFAFGSDGRALLSVAYYLVSEGSSTVARFELWSRTHVHPLGHGLTSQRISELFRDVSQDNLEKLFSARIRRTGKDYWFYDTTSISSYSQFIESVRWGKNKDRIPLPQINLAAVLDAASGLPVYFKNVAGNISDISMVRSLLADASRMGTGRMKLCMDRGFYSKDNIDILMGEHLKFLVGLKTSSAYVASVITEHAYELQRWQNYNEQNRVFGLTIPYPWDFEHIHSHTGEVIKTRKRTYLHLYYLPERAVKDEEEMAQLLHRLSTELNSNHRYEEHSQYYERYFRRIRGGRYIGRDDVIAAERAHFGYFAILSNDASLNAHDTLAIYRNKDMVEKAFGDIKDRLDFRTPKVENSETLRGKLLAVFVALILTCELKQRMNSADLYARYTMQGLLDELDTIERYESDGHRPRVLAVTKKQRELYEALRVEPLTTS